MTKNTRILLLLITSTFFSCKKSKFEILLTDSSKKWVYVENLKDYPAQISYIKFETVYGEVAQLENFITVTYYVGLDIYEKNFSFQASQLEDSRPIPFLDVEGFLLD